MVSEPFGSATLRRIEWLTLALGALGAVWAGWRWGWRGSAGLAVGAVLSWLNFRWLKGSVQAFDRVATAQAGSASVAVPKSAYFKFFGRFALLLGTVYVILTRSWVPTIPVFAGLFASSAAVVLALVYELLWSGVRQDVSGRS
jgi:ATP synthase I chain